MIAEIKEDGICCLCRKEYKTGDKVSISGPWLSEATIRDCPETIPNSLTNGLVCPQCRMRLGKAITKTYLEIIKESEDKNDE